MKSKELLGSVTAGLRWATLSRLMTQVITWGTTLIVVRLLSPSDYGLAAMATVLSGYLAMWNELGFSITLVQKKTTDLPTLRAVLGLLLAIGACLCALMFLSAPLIAAAFADTRITPLARLAGLNFLIMPFTIIPYAQLLLDMNYKAISFVGVISATVGAVVTLSMAWFDFGAAALVVGTLCGALARGAMLNYFRSFLRRPEWNLPLLKGFASFSGNVMLGRTVWYWYAEADNLIVGRMLGAAALGVYSLGRQLAQMPMERAAEMINLVSLSAYTAVNHDLPRVRDAYIKTIGIVASVTFPLFWGMALVADDLVHTILGPKWVNAIPVLQLLCLSMPLRTVGTLASMPLMALGRAERSLHFVLFPAIIVPLSMLLGVRWGVLGVAVAWAVAYPIAFVLGSNFIKGTFQARLRDMLRPLVAPAVAGAAMSAAVYGFMKLVPMLHPIPLFIGKVAIGAAVYPAVLFFIARPQFEQALGFAKSFLKRN